MERIDELYHQNNQRESYKPGTKSFEKYDAKLRRPVAEVKALTRQKCEHQGQKAVIESMQNHWAGLTFFVDNPEVEMDNNIS